MESSEVFNIVELTLEGLKKRLDSNNSLLIQGSTGYSEPAKFTFYPGSSNQEIDSLFEEFNLVIPWDYKAFLLSHNGADLFEHPFYGGGIQLYSLNMIRQVYIDYDYVSMIPQGWIPIGSDNGDMLFLNTNECIDRFSSYLYWTEMLFVDSAIKVDMNFERWFERLIICNGAHFWNWNNESSERYYRHLQGHIENVNNYDGKNYTLALSKKE
ncbi:SMI1/KNR4 family protein [Paenibacillus sp. FSL H8-0079]|uniref:SMI1/KNR4 family protein n=1 Tax=Paenibacillus sp. FSL H8-0079 TaxID=2921375 RepID=UPI0030EC1C2E